MYEGHVTALLYVSDLRRSVAFYRDQLGFHFTGYWDPVHRRVKDDYESANDPAYAGMNVGESHIGLHADPEFSPGRPRVELHVPVADADAVHQVLTERGVQATEPQDEPWGSRVFSVTDPDGHAWDFMEDLTDP